MGSPMGRHKGVKKGQKGWIMKLQLISSFLMKLINLSIKWVYLIIYHLLILYRCVCVGTWGLAWGLQNSKKMVKYQGHRKMCWWQFTLIICKELRTFEKKEYKQGNRIQSTNACYWIPQQSASIALHGLHALRQRRIVFPFSCNRDDMILSLAPRTSPY